MSVAGIRFELNAFLGFVERQGNLTKRYWAWELVWFFYSLVSVLSIGYLASGLGTLGLNSSTFSLHQAQLYLLVGSLLWGYLSLVFNDVAYAISWERWEGTIEYTFMAPVKRITHLMGICLWAIVYGMVRAGLVLVAAILLFNIDLRHADLGAAAAILAVSTLPLVGLGILTSVLPLLSPGKGEQLTVAAQGFLLLVSGVYYPLSVLPLPLRIAGQASPLTYTLQGIRDCLLGDRHLGDELPNLLLLGTMGVLLIPLGLAVFGVAERRAKRLGLLKRSG